MNIGILTFHYTNNVGSALQAFALQQTVSGFGANCYIINYQKQGWKMADYHGYLHHMKQQFGFAGYIAWLSFIPVLKLRRAIFCNFQRKYVKLNSKKVLTKNELKNIEDNFDKIIVGSDQIWNPLNIKSDFTYYLDFVVDSTKKIAYAPSFGVSDLPEDCKPEVAKLLEDIKYLSAREIQGAELIKSMTEKEPPIVLDPTFFLPPDQWRRIARPPSYSNYIFVYLRKPSSTIASYAMELSKVTGYPIVQVTGIKRRVERGRRIKNPNPQVWLGHMLNAAYVITNSFHGVAFSINFNKQFAVELIDDPIQGQNNSRLLSILSQFGLQDRIIPNNNGFVLPKAIDYMHVNKIMSDKKNASIGFLKKAIFGDD